MKDKKRKDNFKDDGKTVADMRNIIAPPGLFDIQPRSADSANETEKKENKKNNESVPFALTEKEKRAMTIAAWILGLKVAAVASAALLAVFLIMHILIYFLK